MRARRLLGLWLLAVACKEPADRPPIEIGVVAPLTGPQATYGVSAKNGIDLAVKEQNAAGGVLKRRLEVVHLDDQGVGEIAADAARRLITEERVDLLIGEVSSDAAQSMAPIAQRALTPMLTPAATSPRITELGEYVFRICFVDPFQADAMARFAVEELKVTKAAVLQDLGSVYSIGLAEAFAKRFTQLGGTVVASEHFEKEEALEKLLEKIGAAEPEVVYLPAYHSEVQEIAKQRALFGEGVILLGSDSWDANELLLVAGAALEGSYFTTHWSTDDPRPGVRTFVEAYLKEYNELPDAPAALGYDTARYAIAAIQAAETAEKAEVRDALATLVGFNGVTGPIRLDEKRNAVKPAVVLKVEGSTRKYVRSVAPF